MQNTKIQSLEDTQEDVKIEESSQYVKFSCGAETSERIDKLALALCQAQAQMGHAVKDSKNPYFNSSYANLSQIIDVVRPHLSENNICFIQIPDFDGNFVKLTTRLMHSSGQFIQSTLHLKVNKCDPQSVGSAITYARRYSLSCICGVTQEDDDGERCTDRKEETQKRNNVKNISEQNKKIEQAKEQKQEKISQNQVSDIKEKLDLIQDKETEVKLLNWVQASCLEEITQDKISSVLNKLNATLQKEQQ